MVGRRKLPDPLLNRIFNGLSIGVQYTLSFERTNFVLKYLLMCKNLFCITEKRPSYATFFLLIFHETLHRPLTGFEPNM